jgi:hypothetical protein
LAPAFWVVLAGLFVDLVALKADGDGGPVVTLVTRYELDAAMSVSMVLPVHNNRNPLASLRLAGKRLAVGIPSILGCAEQ